MYFTVLFALYLGACVGSVMTGGRQSLTEEDLGSEPFHGFVLDAEMECNNVVNSESWFVLEGSVNGTKQVVSGVKYEFSFVQKESDCKKEVIFVGGNETSCEIKENGLKHTCIAEVLYAPHIGPPIIKVHVVDVSPADADQEAEQEVPKSVETTAAEEHGEPSSIEPIGEQSQH